jgi:hypothetical protein
MFAIYGNFVLDNKAVIKMTGVEVTDVTITVSRHTDADALALEIEKMPEVKKTSMFDWVPATIDGEDIVGFVSNDFSLLETVSAYEGRFPKWDNEVAMPGLLADAFGKTIGDTVKTKANGVTQDYIICGFFSTTNNNGRVFAITLDGFRRLNPNLKRSTINVYLDNAIPVEGFVRKLEQSFGVINVGKPYENAKYSDAKARAEEKISNYLEYFDIDSVEYAVMYNGEIILSGSSDAYQIENIMNFRELIDSQIGIYTNGISLTTQIIALVSFIIIALILMMTARSIISKRRREFGALKAGGHTTMDLAVQLGVSFLPAAAFGVLIGCVGGGILINPFFEMGFQTMGVKNAGLTADPAGIALIGLVIMLVTFGITTLSAFRIKDISAYELLTE